MKKGILLSIIAILLSVSPSIARPPLPEPPEFPVFDFDFGYLKPLDPTETMIGKIITFEEKKASSMNKWSYLITGTARESHRKEMITTLYFSGARFDGREVIGIAHTSSYPTSGKWELTYIFGPLNVEKTFEVIVISIK